METPVAFLIFNRPDKTQRVFEAIRQARPKQLLVVADGPRPDRPDEPGKCAAVRAVVERVDWPCEVQTNFAATNLGCKYRVSSGLDWVFSQVPEAIILEDDCLPSPSFFSYCAELLERYRDDTRIMHIGGNNFQNGITRTPYSYYFSRLPHIWGWATWRRAWKFYDVEMRTWPQFQAEGRMKILFPDESACVFWIRWMDSVLKGELNTWDAQWYYACLKEGGLALLPEVNLVTNIGAGADATHTTGESGSLGVPSRDIWNIQHPAFIVVQQDADDYTFQHHFRPKPTPFAAHLRNKHFYGAIIRKLPVAGTLWTKWREPRKSSLT